MPPAERDYIMWPHETSKKPRYNSLRPSPGDYGYDRVKKEEEDEPIPFNPPNDRHGAANNFMRNNPVPYAGNEADKRKIQEAARKCRDLSLESHYQHKRLLAISKRIESLGIWQDSVSAAAIQDVDKAAEKLRREFDSIAARVRGMEAMLRS